VKAKPDPEVFLIAASRLHLPPEDCVVIEDAQAGIAAANTAGMYSLGIGAAEVLSEADAVFMNFTEMQPSFLEEILRLESKPHK
jgi:beta-phosphoglucomutase